MSDDRAALFLEDILATPDVLDGLLDAYSNDERGPDHPFAALDRLAAAAGILPTRLVLTGMGSSRCATEAFAGDHTVRVEIASARTSAPAGDVVLLGISNSGRTPEVVDAIREHHGTSLTIGLTNHPDRPVGAEADIALPLLAGDERSGIASRSYAATLAVLALLLAELRREERSGVVDQLRAGIAAARQLRVGRAAWLPSAADTLDGADEIHVIGDGREIGALEQAALMFREAPRLRALPMDAGDWLHVGLYTLLPGGRAILFGGTPYDAEIAETVAQRGGRLVVAGPAVDRGTLDGGAPDGPARDGKAAIVPVPQVRGKAARAIVAAGVAELIAAELWLRAGS